MSLPVFYEKPVALSNQNHADLRLQAGQDYRFTAQSNSVLLTAVEFAKACQEYPIVFVQEEDTVHAVAILGLKQNQNLFVDNTGQWLAGYVPAYVRRYPFILAQQEGGDSAYTVCIDENYPGFNRETGERLFLEDGQQSEFLKRALTLLQEFQAAFQRSGEFGRRLLDWGLLQPLQANIQLNSGGRFSLTGFMVVNRDALKDLAPERAAQLLKQDEMGAIYYHLLSLNNFGRLVDRIAEAA